MLGDVRGAEADARTEAGATAWYYQAQERRFRDADGVVWQWTRKGWRNVRKRLTRGKR
jgi:hypothetical protein